MHASTEAFEFMAFVLHKNGRCIWLLRTVVSFTVERGAGEKTMERRVPGS